MKKAVGIFIMLVVFAVGSVFAQGFPKEAENLLNPTQKAKIEKLRTDFQKQKIELNAKIRVAQLDLREMLRSSRVPDLSKIDKKQAEISRLKNQMATLRLHHLIAVRKVLTDEQWQKIQQFRGSMMKRNMRDRMGKKMHHGMRPPMRERCFERPGFKRP
ncbi:MAG: hypothetical protein GXO76_04365 [Calditrichaeota bacterium]|nr:hypothetical protein [Calditrichota bacterium]